MQPCEHYIYRQEQPQQGIMLAFHQFFTTYPKVVDKIHYTVPFYFQFGAICYLNPKKKGVELVFVHGQKLSNEQQLLQANERKQVAGILIEDAKKIPMTDIIVIFEEALLLDEQLNKEKKLKKQQKNNLLR